MILSAEYLASKCGQSFSLKKIENDVFPRKTAVGRFMGLDAIDRSMLLLGLALASVLVVLI